MSIIFERATLKTRKGSAVKRSKWGVGKDIGGSLYVHIDYIPDEFKQMVADARTQVSIANSQFTPNVVRIDYKKGGVAFYDSVEFDTVQEPAAGMMITYRDGVVSKPRQVNQIWHHKWLWVGDDYRGFDTSQSYDRSAQWLDHDDIPFAKIGNKKTWREWLSSVNLTEAFDRPSKIHWVEKRIHSWGGTFTVNGDEYAIAIQYQEQNDAWELVFLGMNSSGDYTYSATGRGNMYGVFATVMSGMREFIDEREPETIYFSAERDIKNDSDSRIKLYNRLVKRYADTLPNYTYKTVEGKVSTKTYFIRK
ncbi:hypothetical protein [Vibrio phage XZ1]|uniref:Uncharacterized protein n=1 Tax=Vibrio phage ValKK3 TaxID=1610855 RepID=A0A0D4DBT3_9CAUD|nr:hypothetical protein AVU32_gp276 [Vibrio phage ValKK3]AJT61117.1 hypothetical protein [Vibrio phage ValKK3]QNJ55115.1 hypothetical protein vBValMR11Z_189 [Vibrio phage vB_ValM_R11Z]UOL51164.1 hypothetical protein [Vibrio phage XZ1]